MESRSFRLFVEEKLGKFPHFVIYAVLEWILIIFLLIDGFIVFFCNEFAKFFELETPCMLCTRIDHVLTNRSPDFYYNESMCEAHMQEISSLAYCHVHQKLSGLWSMCEGCLLSFTTGTEADGDTYRSFIGNLRKDMDFFSETDPKMHLKSGKKDDVVQADKSFLPRCSCCGEPLKRRPSSSKCITRSPSINGNLLSQAPAPSPRASVLPWKCEDTKNLELPHIRYTELKFSDNESEVPDDEESSNLDTQSMKEDIKAATVPLLPDYEDMNEDATKTPNFAKGNRFFGIPLTDSAAGSPRWAPRLQKKLQIEKSDLFPEIDTNAASEADREAILQRLKRQVRLDRKSLIALYMELDEERSASAVAANNAMAMITRLQAEKAAVQMEALQYQRMMEEQAEFDQEALQDMRDFLVKREDEIRVLEAELDSYREKYGPLKQIGNEGCEMDAEDYQGLKSQSMMSPNECDILNEVDQRRENEYNVETSGPLQEVNGGGNLEVSEVDFEHEKSYLLGQLKNLEEKIKLSSDDQSHSSQSTSGKDENKDIGHEDKTILTNEISKIRKRLRALEADGGFLNHTVMTLQQGDEGTKVLMETAQHLGKLRHPEKMPPEDVIA